MKIAVVGAGAVGGMLGARFSLAGEEVTLVCRGAHLDAIREKGISLIERDGTRQIAAPALATDRVDGLETHDLVLLTLKAHQLADVAPRLSGLIGPETVVVTLQNGI